MLASSAYITWCKLSETKKVYFLENIFYTNHVAVLRGILKTFVFFPIYYPKCSILSLLKM